MALGNSASVGNIKRSFDRYLYDNLVSISNLNVDFRGLPFSNIEKGVTWIVPRILDFDSTFYRQGNNTQYGEDVNILFQISIFTKQSSTITSSEHYRVRDVVKAYFKIGKDITVYDYVTPMTIRITQTSDTRITEDGDTRIIDKSIIIDRMRIRDVKDILLPEREEFYQHVLSMEISYTRLTASVISFVGIGRTTEDNKFRITETGIYRIIG